MTEDFFFFFFKFRRKVLAQLQETSLQNKREARQEDRSDLSHRCLTVVFFVQRNVLCNFFLFFFFWMEKKAEITYMIVLKEGGQQQHWLYGIVFLFVHSFLNMYLSLPLQRRNLNKPSMRNWKGALGWPLPTHTTRAAMEQLWMALVWALMVAARASAHADVECPWHSSIEVGILSWEIFIPHFI